VKCDVCGSTDVIIRNTSAGVWIRCLICGHEERLSGYYISASRHASTFNKATFTSISNFILYKISSKNLKRLEKDLLELLQDKYKIPSKYAIGYVNALIDRIKKDQPYKIKITYQLG